MPELWPGRSKLEESNDFAKTVGELDYDFLHRVDMSKLSNRHPDVVGAGSECYVIDLPDNQEKVAAVLYNENLSSRDAKRLYYSHKILQTLFPHNFPKIHMAKGEDDKSVSKDTGTIREKVHESEEISGMIKKVMMFRPTLVAKYPFWDVENALHKLGCEMKFDRRGAKNFVFGEDGGEYYLDAVVSNVHKNYDSHLEQIDEKVLTDYMIQNNYSELDQKRVLQALKRLKVIVTDSQ